MMRVASLISTFSRSRRRWAGSWLVSSVLASACGSVLDLAILLLGAHLIGLSAPLAAACGVAGGATANFLLTRRFAFGAQRQDLAGAALRFAAGTSLLIAIHAAVVAELTRIAVPLLVAKYGADISVLLGGNLLLVRYFVFRDRRSSPSSR